MNSPAPCAGWKRRGKPWRSGKLSGAVGTSAHLSPRGGGARLPETGPSARARRHAGGAARFARRVHRRPGAGRGQHRTVGHRIPPLAAHRSSGGGGIFRAGAKGFQRHAAQAQPDHRRTPDRAGARAARQRRGRAGERRPLARARHQPQLGGADHFPRFLHAAGLHAGDAAEIDRRPDRLSREHEAEPGALAWACGIRKPSCWR